MREKIGIRFISLGILYLVQWTPSFGQVPPPQPLRLDTVVDLALRHYPSLRAAEAQVAAAGAGVDLARTAYLPRTDLLWQENRATRNNVLGLLLPQSVIPAISGPVLERSSASVWGSAAGALFSWEPFDFGLRRAQVDLAGRMMDQARAGVGVTQLDVATIAADIFLALAASEQTIRAAQANVDRMQVFAHTVHALVDNQLRPGVDASRADAELAGARIQLIQAQQMVDIQRASLAEALGLAGTTVTIDAGRVLQLPTAGALPPPRFEEHPLARVRAAAVETVRAREHVLNRSYFPRFIFQSAFSDRGTGALTSGGVKHGAKGLLPQTLNWASGLAISFPIFDFAGLRARRRAEASNELAERARYDQIIQNLTAQDARARALIDGARRIAENTPIQLRAARETETRARVRYDAGLASITEVAEAHRLLAQAEIDDAVARLGVWRGLLAAARAQGDLTPFLQLVK